MGSDEHETETRARHVCPACKHPVVSEMERHKSLGVFVPVWHPAPCRNPECAAYVPEADGERSEASGPHA
ncbi:hypothetical protein GCM10010346_23430 [Streptomyces chryseus]|uniref:Uncharacterized protein n=1 Tax=Streptomyces chryseus TaxID=68186 RepID=A0ABQ3DIX5_9ACTN|nr:hypothetical protein [Streptomyces chryseus]GHA99892.1 hypothetical protein GCM10010346_23430 [Streptomyces chryseus]